MLLGEGGGIAPASNVSGFFAALADFVPGSEVREDLAQLARVRHRLDLLMAQLAAQLDDSTNWKDEPYDSTCQFLREEGQLDTGSALRQLEAGHALAALPLSVEALEQGEIGFGHLALIARTMGCYRNGGFDERQFVRKAKRQNVTVFRKTCEHARHAQDPDGFADTEREDREQRFLKLSPTEGGGLGLTGWLDPESGSRLRSALEPLAKKAGVGDERNRQQRLADALLEATAGEQETELIVTCSLETLVGQPGAPAAETEWGDLLSGQTVERLVCGGSYLRRMLLDSQGVVIDYGRRKRLLSPQGKAALKARDKRCTWPGCDRPPRWCDSHHLKEWHLGGGTSVGESALLCGRHHRMRHERGWHLFRDSQGEWQAVPPLPPNLAD